MKRQYVELPIVVDCGFLKKVAMKLLGLLLTPIYYGAAIVHGAPGLAFHFKSALAGLWLLVTLRASVKVCYNLIFYPMDSTRYFEFQEVWARVRGMRFTRYLDVSSPRLFPLLLLKEQRKLTAVLLNPDRVDLSEAEQLAKSLKLGARCTFYNGLIDERAVSVFAPASFDLITSISVLEHIPKDRAAIESMWALLRPGGKLILSVPCMSAPLEQYISQDLYGLLKPGEDGYTFYQRYYDSERLLKSVYSVTGEPVSFSILGEKVRGLFFRSISLKRILRSCYPGWREAYMMGTEYSSYPSIEALPGEGVIVLEFVKKA